MARDDFTFTFTDYNGHLNISWRNHHVNYTSSRYFSTSCVHCVTAMQYCVNKLQLTGMKKTLCVPRTKQAYFCTIHCAQLSNMAELAITSQSYHDVKSATTLFWSNVQDLIWRCITLHSTHLLCNWQEFTENRVTLQNTVTDSSAIENNEKQAQSWLKLWVNS